MPDTLPQGPKVISRLAPQQYRVTRQNGTGSASDNYLVRYPDWYHPGPGRKLPRRTGRAGPPGSGSRSADSGCVGPVTDGHITGPAR